MKYDVAEPIALSNPDWRKDAGETVSDAELAAVGQSKEDVAALVEQGSLIPKRRR